MNKQLGLFLKILSMTGLFLWTLMSVSHSHSLPNIPAQTIEPKWRCNVLSSNLDCSYISDDNGHIASPVLADIDGDEKLDIVVATREGRVILIKDNGSSGEKVWNVDVAPAFSMAGGTQVTRSSPAIADIDGDGFPEIVFGTGKEDANVCYKGGVIVLDHNGNTQAGWPQMAVDEGVPPPNCPDPMQGTPALGDLDNDGDLEIVIGGFDKRIYAWHHTGELLNGFPADSALQHRFPTWGLEGRLADSIWGSPALADLDGDSFLDIIIGTDEGNFDARWGGDSGGWSCPYALPPGWAAGYCGGTLYALDRFGNSLPNFPRRILEHIQSTPALFDIDGDGQSEIFVSTGTFYYDHSPDHPTNGFRLFGWDAQGNDLPGWSGGKITGGPMPASPSIGDLDGDGDPEIVALSMDKKLYAFHHTGQPVSGFPMTPRDQTNRSYGYNVGRTPILADLDGDGDMEIFIVTAWSVTIVNGQGTQLTTTSNPPNAPFYYAHGNLSNNATIGDVDGDDELELVVNNSNVYVWDLPGSGSADWPMFKHNAARTGLSIPPAIRVTPSALVGLHETGDSSDILFDVAILASGGKQINWTASESDPDFSMNPTSGTVHDIAQFTVTVARSALSPGQNNIGTVIVSGTIGSSHVANSPTSLPITVYLVDTIFRSYLPINQR